MKIPRLTDQIIFKIIESELYKYLSICGKPRVKEEYFPKSIEEVLKHKKYDDILKRFIELFIKEFSEEEIKSLFYRLKTLEISDKEYLTVNSMFYLSLGYYESKINKITLEYYHDRRISKESVEETFIHELFHLASTRRTEDGLITGLEIPGYLGEMLNEGYTDYLTAKYFTKKMAYVKSPSIGIYFSKGIENIIGKEKMQKYYFNADLNALVNELSKYTTKEDIVKLLFLVDRQNGVLRGEQDILRIIREIAEINKRKLDADLRNGKISFREYQIEYAIKVKEYLIGNIWSEETRIIEDDNCFVLEDQGFTSRVYEIKENPKNKVKYYQ